MKKLGPNDPCHCGSGHKLKKCCFTVLLPTKKVYVPSQDLLDDLAVGKQNIKDYEASQSRPDSDIPEKKTNPHNHVGMSGYKKLMVASAILGLAIG